MAPGVRLRVVRYPIFAITSQLPARVTYGGPLRAAIVAPALAGIASCRLPPTDPGGLPRTRNGLLVSATVGGPKRPDTADMEQT